ncbi:hypothetical protein AHF37_04730 [Paragonimus kellicotti]|nr:hypothetical protein AHF37_04730 [Paragonimus kellicotti]
MQPLEKVPVLRDIKLDVQIRSAKVQSQSSHQSRRTYAKVVTVAQKKASGYDQPETFQKKTWHKNPDKAYFSRLTLLPILMGSMPLLFYPVLFLL